MKSHLIPTDGKSWHSLQLRQMLTKRAYHCESFSLDRVATHSEYLIKFLGGSAMSFTAF